MMNCIKYFILIILLIFLTPSGLWGQSLLSDSQWKQSSNYFDHLESPESFVRQAFKELARIRFDLYPKETKILTSWSIEGETSLEALEQLTASWLKQFPNSRYLHLIHYYYIKARSLQEKPINPYALQQDWMLLKLPATYQSDFLHIQSEAALKQGDVTTAVRILLHEYTLSSTKQISSPNVILELLRQLPSLEALESIEDQYDDVPFLEEEFTFLNIYALIKEQRYYEALDQVDSLLSDTDIIENTARFQELSFIQKRIHVAQDVHPQRIGVILPLSSQNPQVSQLVKDTIKGLRLALIAANPPPLEVEPEESLGTSTAEEVSLEEEEALTPEPSLPIELIFRDSHLDPIQTLSAVRELIERENVIAIVGPLIRSTSEAAAIEAQRWNVPLISLSLTPDIPNIGSFVFRNHHSWKQEVEHLVQYAMDYQQAKRFLLLYPLTREGRYKKEVFQNAVKARGGSIHAIRHFKPNQKSFVKDFRAFTGIDRYIPPRYRSEELEMKTEAIVDFDALFIPIRPRNVRDLKVLLPYPRAHEMQNTLLLGDSGWNDNSAPFALGNKRQRLMFVDSFFKGSQRSPVKEFIRLYKRYYAYSLSYESLSTYSAYAYDSINILKKLIEQSDNPNHQQLQTDLLRMPPYDGVMSGTRFLHNGEGTRELQHLTFRRNRIVELTP